MNYEKSKVQVDKLKMDTVGLRFAISRLKQSNLDYKATIDHHNIIMFPLKDSINRNLTEENSLLVKQGRQKYWKGTRDGTIVGIILAIVSAFAIK